ncbi:MAG: hypothetical protein K6B72_05760 [Lachnospiraceae bacterium]|nr:hypothetical protein [Lachnospiraceae bacterium]
MHRRRRAAAEEEHKRTGSFYDEDGRLHIRVQNIGDVPPTVIKRRKSSTPLSFDTVRPQPKKEEKEKEEKPVQKLGDGRVNLIDEYD